MASAYQKAGKWYARYRDGTGRWRDKVLPDVTTKRDALRNAVELNQHGWRQREGLEALPSRCTLTLAELCSWWLKAKCKPLSRERETLRLNRNVSSWPIGKVPVPKVTGAMLDAHLDHLVEKEGKSPATANHVRAVLRTVFNRARKAGKWTGLNPVLDVERRKEVRRSYSTLRAEEVPLFLAQVPADWQPLFAAALYTAMRKGELFGLLKSNVDIKSRIILVAHSYDHDTTKGGHADAIPIAEPLVPFLEKAIESAGRSELVFPIAGEMADEHEPLHRVLRRALAKAGLVVGWDHVCRRCKGKKKPVHTWRFADAAERRCPECDMLLWAKAVQRGVRFHDLRHTTATLLLQAKEPAQHVQRILRHASVVTTTGTYGHLLVDDLRASMGKLPGVAGPVSAASLAASLLHAGGGEIGARALPDGSARADSAFPLVPDEIRTRVTGLKGTQIPPSEPRKYSQGAGNTRDGPCSPVQISDAAEGAFRKDFAASLRRVASVEPEDELLTVAEVAKQLRVSTASVYDLCARGELSYTRVLSARIRVSRSDLVAFRKARQSASEGPGRAGTGRAEHPDGLRRRPARGPRRRS